MNRTIKDATVRRYHYDTHEQLRARMTDFVSSYNFARRLKTLCGVTPYEAICKAWSAEPFRFRSNPVHQMPGPNTFNGRVAVVDTAAVEPLSGVVAVITPATAPKPVPDVECKVFLFAHPLKKEARVMKVGSRHALALRLGRSVERIPG